ncbi:hypothetical protein L596_006786 [Steinernema carpocapsae]|uniref:Uncharacterized protein n=1 Tax=Steinernema carpocapsae TaxID=34508 RepID=A0A4U5P6T8_STECR|nr:hypothetical protein L596_006786 [Steinernema carpocapsae]
MPSDLLPCPKDQKGHKKPDGGRPSRNRSTLETSIASVRKRLTTLALRRSTTVRAVEGTVESKKAPLIGEAKLRKSTRSSKNLRTQKELKIRVANGKNAT